MNRALILGVNILPTVPQIQSTAEVERLLRKLVKQEKKSWLTRVNDILRWPCNAVFVIFIGTACWYHPEVMLPVLIGNVFWFSLRIVRTRAATVRRPRIS